MVVGPTRTCVTPVKVVKFEYGTPRLTSAALATSHGVWNLLVPTGLNCTEQPFAGSCVLGTSTTTGADCCAASSAGLAKCVICLKIGKYVSAASKHPARMILLRPMRSEREPKMMKNGVPSTNERA